MPEAKGLEVTVSIVDDEIVAARKECLTHILNGIFAIVEIGASEVNGEIPLTEDEQLGLSSSKPLSSKLPIYDGLSIQALITTITECLVGDHLLVNVDDKNGRITGCRWHNDIVQENGNNAR